MLRKYFIISLTLILFSCGDDQSDKVNNLTQLKDYNELVKENIVRKPKSDTLALGFVFGQTSDTVEKHIQKLIDQDKLKPKTSSTFSLVTISGYPYELFLSDSTSCESLMTYSLYNNKLATLTFFISTSMEDVINGRPTEILNLLEKKFGSYQATTMDSSNSTEPKPTYYWFDGYKKISFTEILTGDYVIEYSDIRVENENKLIKNKQDSIDAELRKKKIENSQNDLK